MFVNKSSNYLLRYEWQQGKNRSYHNEYYSVILSTTHTFNNFQSETIEVVYRKGNSVFCTSDQILTKTWNLFQVLIHNINIYTYE